MTSAAAASHSDEPAALEGEEADAPEVEEEEEAALVGLPADSGVATQTGRASSVNRSADVSRCGESDGREVASIFSSLETIAAMLPGSEASKGPVEDVRTLLGAGGAEGDDLTAGAAAVEILAAAADDTDDAGVALAVVVVAPPVAASAAAPIAGPVPVAARAENGSLATPLAAMRPCMPRIISAGREEREWARKAESIRDRRRTIEVDVMAIPHLSIQASPSQQTHAPAIMPPIGVDSTIEGTSIIRLGTPALAGSRKRTAAFEKWLQLLLNRS